MSEWTKLDCHHPEIVEAFASAWASIDGKSAHFEQGKSGYDEGGYYEGYMAEAAELLNRAGKRITAFDLFDRLDPSVDKITAS